MKGKNVLMPQGDTAESEINSRKNASNITPLHEKNKKSWTT